MDLRASWGYIEEIARKRLENNKTSNHVSDYGEDIEILGAAGELAARRFFGISEQLHTRFDGGHDLVWNGLTIDVKATHLTPRLNFRYLQWPEWKPIKAAIILMVAVDLRNKKAAIAGYATCNEVARAPINFQRDYPCREISIPNLHPGWELLMPNCEENLPYLTELFDPIRR